MSVPLQYKEPPPTRANYRRRRVGVNRSGLSVLARGEAMIWLTGGALAVCLAMISGLLLLVIVAGLSTFWPQPIVLVELHDGSVHMGEITREESYTLTPAMIEQLDSAVAAEARKRLQDEEPATAHRRLFRTGNFELTGAHFHWINDFAVRRESRPEWAVLVERLEWGRFYGMPEAFVLRQPRQPGDAEQRLLDLLQFLQANRFRASDEAAQQQVDQAIQTIENAVGRERQESVAALLKQGAAAQGAQTQAVLEDGRTIPIRQAAATADVQAVQQIWRGSQAAWNQFQRHQPRVGEITEQLHELEREEIGQINTRLEDARLAIREQEIEYNVEVIELASEWEDLQRQRMALEQAQQAAEQILQTAQAQSANVAAAARTVAEPARAELASQIAEIDARIARLRQQVARMPQPVIEVVQQYLETSRVADEQTAEIQKRIDELREQAEQYALHLQTAQGQPKELMLNEIVRAYPANQLTFADRLGVYFSRWGEFLTDEPREANSEGGVFPAIWGTVAMTLIMSLAVVPFGVLAALYLREYARGGLVVSIIRISINNLAGVPSIVYGVFGLGFFCYRVGAYIDGGAQHAGFRPWPEPAWFAALAGLAIIAVLAFAIGMFNRSGSRADRGALQRWLQYLSIALWLIATALIVVVIAVNPYFNGFFNERLPNPTFGKGGLLWASLTLALLTLPVVIVATEEALASVPNSLREGSYAAGASKWQTLRRIVLPHAAPGIMTGMILAMARGAGEVAPLMLVGAVKLAPELPIDTNFPYIHPERSFMHLGFHIFDLGFHSQNSEASKPMVFTTTLLLIAIIAVLNLAAIGLRSRLRRRFMTSHF